jgi:hypothetical protein
MKRNGSGAFSWTAKVGLVTVCAFLPIVLNAQAPQCSSTFYYTGDKAAWGTSTVTPFSAHAYIDASQKLGTSASNDVCAAINNSLTQLNTGTTTSNCPEYHGKGVIDARGVVSSSGNFACTANPFPAATSTNNTGAYVTVLLPAGTIPITGAWVLPPNTRLIGEGSVSPAPTTIKPGTGFPDSALIYMGDEPTASFFYCPNNDCNGISIEHLALDGSSVSGLSGIVNNYAQELNYVNDVAIKLANSGTGIGLTIKGQANNSGPHTNIYYSGAGTCVSINGTNNTRGLNGVDCNWSGSGTAPAAILVDGRNNTIQNVTISAYTGDGIAIGSNASAQSNLLFHVRGTSSLSKVVHITKTGTNVVSDLTLMGIRGSTTGVLIDDDVSGSASIKDSTGFVGLYVLGEPVASAGGSTFYSRFTTTTGGSTTPTPVWYQGAGVPTSTTACTNLTGSLYSVTSTSTTSTLWGCINGFWDSLSGNGK